MDTREHLTASLKEAMKAGDDARRNTLRMVMAAIKNIEIDTRTPLTEQQVMAVLQKEVKSRREAIADAEAAGRADLIEAANAEIAILEDFLPQQLGEAELRKIVQEAIAETGAESPRQMGDVMKVVMARVQGRADGKAVSAIARDLLQG